MNTLLDFRGAFDERKTKKRKSLLDKPEEFRKVVLIFMMLSILFEYWLIGICPLIVVLLNLASGFVYLLPGVHLSSWFLAVRRGESTIRTACLSILLNALFVVLTVAALFAMGNIIDTDGNSIDTRWGHIYISVITLTTVGYGNVLPSGMWAEFVAMLASIVGFLGFALLSGIFASVFYAKIVGETAHNQESGANKNDKEI